MTEHISPRINGARMTDFIGRTVRLTCKPIKFSGDNAIVETSDGVQVEVAMLRDANMTDPFCEIIGKVSDASTLKMMACTNIGSDIDMKLVNNVVELFFDPRFRTAFVYS